MGLCALLILALCPGSLTLAQEAIRDRGQTQMQTPVVRITPDFTHQALDRDSEVLADPADTLRLGDVRQPPVAQAFVPAHGSLSSFGFTRAAYWFRFTLDNPLPTPRPMQLVLPTSWLDTVYLYCPDAEGQYRAHHLGDSLPFAQRAHPSTAFVIDLDLAPGLQTCFLRLRTAQAFMTPIELWTPRAFQAQARQNAAYYGMFYGILLVMVLYNGLIWLSTRDRNYAWYCLYLLSFAVMNASYNGFAFQYAWPDAPRWNDWSHTPCIFLYQAVALAFAMSFLESATLRPVVHRVLRGYLLLMLLAWAGVTLWQDPVAYNAAPVYSIIVVTPLILAAGVAAWRRGYQAARFFVLASMASLVGSLCTALTVSGFIPYSFATFHAAEFGILADMVLLSLALADRINLLRAQRKAAEQRELTQQRQAAAALAAVNEALERTVRERTAELAEARDEAMRQARLDTLTGVANRRHFEECAAQEFARAQRYDQPLCLLLFDIDLFKQINDAHGHAAGDAVIHRAATLVSAAVREMDFVARIGGEEFVVLLPGVHLPQALVTAERLREHLAQDSLTHAGQMLRFTASFGVTQLDADDAHVSHLLQRADQAMYRAKRAGRNCVHGQPAHAAPTRLSAP